MEWNNLDYYVRVKDTKKSTFLKSSYKNNQILYNVQGYAESGQLLAIMGPTGCGKTSLLNILSDRIPTGGSENIRLTGNVLINGTKRNSEVFRKHSAYVLQDDKLFAHLTVYETLMLCAHFFLSINVTNDQKSEIVMEIIQELGLIKAKDTIIGDEKTKGISGGERKRANIGTQLIVNPAILFLDEPTSGLDSFQSLSVMESMKALSNSGKLIITVIHQPRSSIYSLFDQLLLLSMGSVVYMGDASAAIAHFSSHRYSCPSDHNPSDYYLDILSPNTKTDEDYEQSVNRINSLITCWKQEQNKLMRLSKTATAVEETVVKAAAGDHLPSGQSKMQSLSTNTLNSNHEAFNYQKFYSNLKLLCWRTYVKQSRQTLGLKIRIGVSIFFSLVVGGIYSNTSYDQSSISDRGGVLFLISVNQAFGTAAAVFNSFPDEKVIVNRERSAGAYGVVSYFFAKLLIELPFNVLPGVFYGIIAYWLTGLNPHTFHIFILILLIEMFTTICMALMVGALSDTAEAANTLGSPLVIISMIFGGLYVDISTLPLVVNLIPYVSFIRWTFQSFLLNEFQGETFHCSASDGSCITDGDLIPNIKYGFHNTDLSFAIGNLLIMTLGFMAAAIVILQYSELKYLPLGHIGRNIKGQIGQNLQDVAANRS